MNAKNDQKLLDDTWALLEQCHAKLPTLGNNNDARTLNELVEKLEGVSMVVLIGDSQVGKTLLMNALLSKDIRTTGDTSTTSHIHIYWYGCKNGMLGEENGIVESQVNADLLHRISLVDTPGCNVCTENDEVTKGMIAEESDHVLFVMAATSVFHENKKVFLDWLQQQNKSFSLVINQMDLLSTEEECNMIKMNVGEQASKWIPTSQVFYVSARTATDIATLQKFIEETLANCWIG